MEKLYTTLTIVAFTFIGYAQTFEFSLSFIGTNSGTNNYQMALVATPSSAVTDGVTADMGAGFYIPSGLTIGNFVAGDSGLPASEWSSTPMGTNASGDAFFVARTESGSGSINLNGAGPFQLVLFDVIATPNPSAGAITFVENGDPIFDTLFVQNYININLGGGTADAYSQNDPAANSVDFATLDVAEDVLTDTSVSIYPNPASNYITVKSSLAIELIEMFDLLGKLVLTSEQTNQIRINQLPAGVYLLKIYAEQGQLTKKIIIE